MAPPSSFSCARQERKEVYHSIWVPMMCHKATLAPIIPIFGLWRPCMGVNGAKNKDSDVQWFSYIFFIFLKDLFYKLSLGCNTSHNLTIFLWKLIKNSYSTNKNLKNYLKLSSQNLEWHWSHLISSNCLYKKNVANTLKLTEKICHGWVTQRYQKFLRYWVSGP